MGSMNLRVFARISAFILHSKVVFVRLNSMVIPSYRRRNHRTRFIHFSLRSRYTTVDYRGKQEAVKDKLNSPHRFTQQIKPCHNYTEDLADIFR
jgi:hypothetical protein